MAFRTVVISTHSKIEYSLEYLIFRTVDIEKRIHMDEISTIIFETTNISVTTRALIELIKRKVNVIFCDEKHNPLAQLNSLYGSHDNSKKIKQQIERKDDTKIKVWKAIVEHKILGQAEVLHKYGREKENFRLLEEFSRHVDLDDVTNREGHAAKVYFNSLFNEGFSRNDNSEINGMLNYGYSLVLSTFNRSISSFGYLTQCGIHHKNEFNSFNFSCDLMEPFRPFVDAIVSKCYQEKKLKKDKLFGIFNLQITIDGTNQTLVNAINIYVSSVISVLNCANNSKLKFPSYDGL